MASSDHPGGPDPPLLPSVSSSAILVNPTKVANLAGLRRTVLKTLAEEGWPEPRWLETTASDTGERQARHAIDSGDRVLFVCGGDGTVLAAVAALAGSGAALAVLPSGTGNVLALNLGLPSDVAGGVRLATRGGRRLIDLGEVDGRPFTVATGIGLDAQMLAETHHRAKHRLGWVAYAAAALRHLAEPRFPVAVRLDGGEPIARQVRSVVVANVGRLPGGIKLLSDSRPDDGLLDVVLIAPHRLPDWLMLLASLFASSSTASRLESFRVRQVEITADQPRPREIDGDTLPIGQTLNVRIRPKVLTVCVPLGRPGRGWPRGRAIPGNGLEKLT